ncbi:SMI1/KNR4 family protein [Burkholderia sp. Se-20378]|uniref:SMI1/KNR4 family protein n=1 Tax=Burkholderia sp. Se-20378 TaxID=2703899 RepID=UPI00197F9588|nr:SMI1/KNR4 family protein [Burkholderia sp. Se-20378]MBN3768832.1 SMI1/KNR4 family protein [Burkholderia sp. Se-20378]
MCLILGDLISENIRSGSEIVISGPVSIEENQEAELLLGVKFSSSYRGYLSEYGAMEIDGRSFAGLTSNPVGDMGDVVAFTRYTRGNYGLPNQYVALDFQDGDAILCIDTSQKDADGESPMALISPVDGRKLGSVAAKNWGDYLVKYLSS